LSAARADGVAHLAEIADCEAGTHGLTTSELETYFTKNLHFQLGLSEQAGLRLYQQRAATLGLVPAKRELVFSPT